MPDETTIIDAHTHIHPQREGFREFVRLLDPERARQNDRAGDLDEALGLMDDLNIQTSLILPWVFAPRVYAERLQAAGEAPETVDEDMKDQIAAEWTAYNDWAIATAKDHPGRFGAMCAIDPVFLGEKRTAAQIERGLEAGAIGLKVVPGFMDARPNDERMAIVWETANTRGLSVTAQCSGPLESSTAHPSYFEDVLRSYPNARVVLAHMGMGGGEDVVAELASKYENVFGDTSSWLASVQIDDSPNATSSPARTPEEAVELFRRIGIDRILYASNYPLTDSREFIARLKALPLTEDERRAVSFENAQRVHRGLGEAAR